MPSLGCTCLMRRPILGSLTRAHSFMPIMSGTSEQRRAMAAWSQSQCHNRMAPRSGTSRFIGLIKKIRKEKLLIMKSAFTCSKMQMALTMQRPIWIVTHIWSLPPVPVATRVTVSGSWSQFITRTRTRCSIRALSTIRRITAGLIGLVCAPIAKTASSSGMTTRPLTTPTGTRANQTMPVMGRSVYRCTYLKMAHGMTIIVTTKPSTFVKCQLAISIRNPRWTQHGRLATVSRDGGKWAKGHGCWLECFELLPVSNRYTCFTHPTKGCYRSYAAKFNKGTPGEPEQMTFQAASQFCSSATPNGKLAMLPNIYYQYFINSLMRNNGHDAWIGALRSTADMTFSWIDNSRITYNFWQNGEPNNWEGMEDKVEVKWYSDNQFKWAEPGNWNDQYSEENRAFVCFDKQSPGNTETKPNPLCPDGWQAAPQVNGFCYKLITGQNTDFNQASSFCQGLESKYPTELASIEDIYEVCSLNFRNSLPDYLTCFIG